MIDSLGSYTSQTLSSGSGISPYQHFFEKFSALLASSMEDSTTTDKKELTNTTAEQILTTNPTSAYTAKSEPWSMETQGSHIVNGVQLVPGAPGYNADTASPYQKEIAFTDAKIATNTIKEPVTLEALLQKIDLSAPVAQSTVASSTTTNPPSAYIAKSEPWSMETQGSHIVNGVQLILGAPGYNAEAAAPYHQEIAQTNAKYFS